jgi:hypothetical protein
MHGHRIAGELRFGEKGPDVRLHHLLAVAEPVETVCDDRRVQR